MGKVGVESWGKMTPERPARSAYLTGIAGAVVLKRWFFA